MRMSLDVYDDLQQLISRAGEELGVEDDTLILLAGRVAELARENWGGSTLYFPKLTAAQLSQRDIAIRRAYRQAIEQIQSQYHVSYGQLRRTITGRPSRASPEPEQAPLL